MNSAERAKLWRQNNKDRVAEYKARRRSAKPAKCALEIVKSRAERKGLEFNLTEDWYNAQVKNGCAITGKEFTVSGPGVGSGRSNPWSPQVDRIDPSRGYVSDNCRLVCAIYNRAKAHWSDQEVLEMCCLVLDSRIANNRT